MTIKYMRAPCGYTVIEGDDDILNAHMSYCQVCKDPVAVKTALKRQRARGKNV